MTFSIYTGSPVSDSSDLRRIRPRDELEIRDASLTLEAPSILALDGRPVAIAAPEIVEHVERSIRVDDGGDLERISDTLEESVKALEGILSKVNATLEIDEDALSAVTHELRDAFNDLKRTRKYLERN